MSTIDSLAQAFMKFPGIGTRQAKRFVYFLLAQDPQFIENFSEEIAELKKSISQCPECFRYFQHLGREDLCNVCSGDADYSLLLVVEKDVDFDSVRRSGGYKGRYFIIGGTLTALEKDPPSKIRINELIARVEKSVSDGLTEVILAFSANPDGDTTHDYVAKMLEPTSKKYGIKITAFGRGLSTGTELEYSDSDTLRNAFKNRQ